jgi:hypothetical protein
MATGKRQHNNEATRLSGAPLNGALSPLLSSLAAAPAGRQSAGISAYITPDGITVIRFSAWRRIVQHAQQLRHKGASPTEVVAYITRKANELEAQWGWLKRLWAARLQRVLRRLALQRGLPMRWDGKDSDLALPETLCFFAALPVSPQECRAPPDNLDASLKPSPSWLSPSTPSFCRAPNFRAALWRCVGGSRLHAA